MKKVFIVMVFLCFLFPFLLEGKAIKKQKAALNKSISVGMTKKQVLKILGEPNMRGGNYWEYQDSETKEAKYVTFNSAELVGEGSALNNLKSSGKKSGSDPKLCDKAGESQGQGADDKFCGKCGKKRGVDDNFCGKCGASYVSEKITPEIATQNVGETQPTSPVFEYKTVFLTDRDMALKQSLDSILNELGKDGWEVISQRRARDSSYAGTTREWGVEVSLKRKIR